MDHVQSVKFAVDIAKGMVYLHSMEPLIPRLYLSSYHVMVSTRRFYGTVVDLCDFVP